MGFWSEIIVWTQPIQGNGKGLWDIIRKAGEVLQDRASITLAFSHHLSIFSTRKTEEKALIQSPQHTHSLLEHTLL